MRKQSRQMRRMRLTDSCPILICLRRTKYVRRFFAYLTCFAFFLSIITGFSGCAGPLRAEKIESEPELELSSGVIAYVPLDDRPDNIERMVYLAESLGYQLNMPDADLYRTRLDAQPKNQNGTQYGDSNALYNWVLAQKEAGCYRYILSLDQLLSGGLVNSRHTTEITDPESRILQGLISELASDPGNQIWLLDSVMRLAPSVDYAGFDLADYQALRAYGMESRPDLTESGSDLTLSRVLESYPLDANSKILSPSRFNLSEQQISDYLAARSRKLSLSIQAQELAQDFDNVRLLIGIDDSSEVDSIQKNEIALLEKNLRKNLDIILSGVDDLAFKAVTKLYLEENDWTGTSVSVQYFGGSEQLPACPYDSLPLTEILAQHLDFFQLQNTSGSPETSAMQILVLTQPAVEDQKESIYRSLINVLQTCQEQKIPVILIDAGNGRYGKEFQAKFIQEVELGNLLSYSGFLDMAIVTGTAISHGVARYARLVQKDSKRNLTTEQAFLRTLADSLIKDFCYKNIVREDLLNFIKQDLSGNPDNFWNPKLDQTTILNRLEQGMENASKNLIDNLEYSHFIISLEPYTERQWGEIVLKNYCFPWDRAFEISMDIQLGEFPQ